MLPPAYVDPASRYCDYSVTQLRNVRLIRLLLGLEILPERIADVLTLSGAEAVRAVTAYGREVEAAARRQLVHYLEGWLEGRGEQMVEVENQIPALRKCR